jgi:hypothetical protein
MSNQLATAVEERFTAMEGKMKMYAATFEQVQEELKVVKNEVKNTQHSIKVVQQDMAAIPSLLTELRLDSEQKHKESMEFQRVSSEATFQQIQPQMKSLAQADKETRMQSVAQHKQVIQMIQEQSVAQAKVTTESNMVTQEMMTQILMRLNSVPPGYMTQPAQVKEDTEMAPPPTLKRLSSELGASESNVKVVEVQAKEKGFRFVS